MPLLISGSIRRITRHKHRDGNGSRDRHREHEGARDDPLGVADLHPFKATTAAEKQRDWRDRESRKRGDLEAENATLRARIEDLEALLTGATALIGHLSGDARDAARPVLEAS